MINLRIHGTEHVKHQPDQYFFLSTQAYNSSYQCGAFGWNKKELGRKCQDEGGKLDRIGSQMVYYNLKLKEGELGRGMNQIINYMEPYETTWKHSEVTETNEQKWKRPLLRNGISYEVNNLT